MRATAGFVVAIVALGSPVGAHAAAKAPAVARSSLHAPADADPSDRRVARGRKLLIGGGVVAGTGLLLGTIAFSVLGGIHAGNPGDGLMLESSDARDRQRTLNLARGMEGLGYASVAMLLSGVVVLAVGGATYRKGLRAQRERAHVSVAPGLGSLSLVGRF